MCCTKLRRKASYSDATELNLTLTNLKSHKLDLLALQSWERVMTKLVSTKFKMPSLPNIAYDILQIQKVEKEVRKVKCEESIHSLLKKRKYEISVMHFQKVENSSGEVQTKLQKQIEQKEQNGIAEMN